MLAALLATVTASSKTPAPETAERIDRVLSDDLEHTAAELAPVCSDTTFVRRVFLDIVGDIPTPEHTTAFLLDPNPDKRAKLVQHLLDQPQYGQNWARYWRDVVLYRRIENRSLLVAQPMVEDLTQRLNAGAGWDKIAARFITAQGDIREQGATAIIAAQEGRTEEVAAEVSRIFLGVQIQCAQCHDHPWDSWKREQFHELAAFFPRVALRPVRSPLVRSFEVAVSDTPERGRRRNNPDANRATPEHYMPDMEDPQAKGTRMQPRFFLTGAKLDYGTRDAGRRGRLADWLTNSPWFSKALVNRMWAELVGEPLFDSIDDIGPERDPKSPKTVELLAAGFAQNSYDLKWLVRAITATDAYQRECRPRRGPDETPMTANVAQRLRGDQLYSALLTALDVKETRRAQLGGNAVRGPGGRTPRLLFNAAFGFDPSVEKESVSASIPQALALMNTPQINNAIRARRGSMLGRLAAEIEDNGLLVDELYLRCLSREPSVQERDQAVAYCSTVDRRAEALEDLLWALLNSAEFAHRR